MAIFLGCGCEVSELQQRMLEPCEQHRQIPIRDYFAAKALSGIFSSEWKESNYADVARRCGLMADAMLREREK